MQTSSKKDRGVNVIALILMVITFFLVIGFSIGALSTINLNLSGRSINVVKANQIAEAAVAAFIYHVEEKTDQLNQDVYLDDLSSPLLNLEADFNSSTRILGSETDGFMGNTWSCDVHFNDDVPYFSTDNSSNKEEKAGALRKIPPFTIDLIITVTLGQFTKHYQVWLSRKWDYAIYLKNGPFYALTSLDNEPSKIEGNIYSAFCPVPVPATGYPAELIAAEIYPPSDEVEDYLVLENRIPPAASYPAAVMIGGKLSRKTIYKSPGPVVTSMTPYFDCTNNRLNGRGVYSYPRPTVFPEPQLYAYPNNNNSLIKHPIFREKIASPFDQLELVDDMTLPSIILLNQETFPDSISREMYVYEDKYVETQTYTAPPESIFIDSSGMPVGDIYNTYAELYSNYYANVKSVFFMKKTLKTVPSPVPTGPEWSDGARFVIRDTDYNYYTLVDRYARCNVFPSPYPPYAPNTVIDFTYTISNEAYQIDPDNNKFIIDNSMLIARQDIELENTDFQGDNSMLQVDGNLHMRSGEISAGENLGAVIYCKNFYCDSYGRFNGVIMVRECMKVGGIDSPGTQLIVNGGILVNGDNPGSGKTIFDFGGLMVSGFTVMHNPLYTRFLNRFGPLRIACWRVLD